MASPPARPLTPRQLVFADAVGRGAPVGRAALAAGYRRSRTGYDLMRDPRVRARVDSVRERLAAELDARAVARAEAAAGGESGSGSSGGAR